MKNRSLLNLIATLLLLLIVVVIALKVISIGIDPPMTDGEGNNVSDEVSRDMTGFFACSDSIIAMDEYNQRSLKSDIVIIETDGRMATRGGNVVGPTGDTNLIMTALILAENSGLNINYVVKDELSLVPDGAVQCGLKAGDILTPQMLMDALLVGKGVDAAYVAAVNIARYASGNDSMDAGEAVKSFIALMNSTASRLSMTSTKYTNISGDYDSAQVTNAEDILKLVKKCREYDSIRDSVKKKSASHRTHNGREISFTGSNKLLDNGYSGFYYDAADGFMIWELADNCHCAVATASFGQNEVIAVLLGADVEKDLYLDIQNAFYPMLSQSVLDESNAVSEDTSSNDTSDSTSSQ